MLVADAAGEAVADDLSRDLATLGLDILEFVLVVVLEPEPEPPRLPPRLPLLTGVALLLLPPPPAPILTAGLSELTIAEADASTASPTSALACCALSLMNPSILLRLKKPS